MEYKSDPAHALGWEDESEAGWQWWVLIAGMALAWDRISPTSRRERRRKRRCSHENMQEGTLSTPWADFRVLRCGDCGKVWDR